MDLRGFLKYLVTRNWRYALLFINEKIKNRQNNSKNTFILND